MSLWSWLFRRPRPIQSRKPLASKSRLQLEALEDRVLMTASVISGFVYQDANNNGVKDPGELAIANSSIQLKNSNGAVVGSTTTDANGFYQFTIDNTISTAPATLTKTVEFPDTPTNWTMSGLLDQFDPSLGTLTSIDVIQYGSITSSIQVENTSTSSGSNITSTVSGNLTLSAPGVNNTINVNQNAGTYNAVKYDGTIDFGGTSGHSFGSNTADGSQTYTLTGSALNAYLGTGKVTVTESANATSTASGGGNLLVSINSTGYSKITVVYHYTPSTALKPGNYTIIQTQQPPGFFDGMESVKGFIMANSVGTDIIPVALGATDSTDNDFGEIPPGQVSGFVYHDANNNGVKDPGEQGIAGVAVALSGGTNATTTTDANGFYQFLNLAPGAYTVTESQPNGWLDGKDAAGTLGGSVANDVVSNIVLPPTGQSNNNNFGELQPASLAGFVYVDANNNGVFDAGETPIQGATVALTGADNNGFVNKTTTTNASGYYEFTNLKPGTYALTETQPAGYQDGKDTIGTPGGSAGNDTFSNIVLQSGVAGVNNNFGELLGSSLSGFVYVDASNDGVKDPGEQAIQGVLVTLTGSTNTGAPVNLTTTTDANGFYQFANLVAGTYTIKETQPAGYQDGKDTLGTPGGAVGNDMFSNVVLQPGFAGVNNNFGELLGSSLSGFVYVDANNDGVKDPGEQAIQGVLVTLTGTTTAGAPVSLTTTTDANGFYQFGNLQAGTYTIKETQPAGFQDGKDTLGTPGGTVGNDMFSNVVLQPGFAGVNNNFGELLGSSLSGFVYFDANNNGVKDSGEQGIQGAQVTLTGTTAGGSVNKTVNTDANGFYQFSNLAPGTYTIKETQPAGYQDGKDAVGSQGGVLGNDQFTNVVLAAGVNGVNNNFGELLAASLSGFVYVDANNNGVKESGEQAIQGVQVVLTGSTSSGAPVNVATTTDANGFYQFSNLAPGTYTIKETQPASYQDGKDAVGSQGGVLGNDQFTNVVLAAGVNGVNNNFGELLGSSLSGFVYFDANNNGVKDAGEQGIQGTQVTLTGSTAGGPVNLTTTTDANGFYQFGNLAPGTYTIKETQPSGYLDGKDAVGSQGGVLGNDQFTSIVLAAGVNGVNNNFGETKTGSLAGFVYVDTNNNGVKDAGEVGIAGVTVKLTGVNELGAAVSLTTTTDTAGAYSFSNLRAGTYTITETQPSAYNDGKDKAGNLGGTAGNDVISSIVLAAGAVGTNYNFGELKILSSDLGIVKTVSSSTVQAGATFTYTLNVTNYGVDAAQNVVVTDALPAGLTFISASGSGWTISFVNGALTATRSSLLAGQSSTITVTVKAPNVATTLTNTSTVTSDTPDSNPTNNRSTVTTTVYVLPPPPTTTAIPPLPPPPPPPTPTKTWYMSLPH